MLDLWLYGTHLATITSERASRMRFTYSASAIDRWGLGSRVFSVAFPIGSQTLSPGPTSAIVEGLLPEGDARQVLNAGFGSDQDLLLALGRDTIGAIVVVPPGEAPPKATTRDIPLLSEGDIAARLRGLEDAPLGVSPRGSVRLSIAGQQAKLPLVRVGDRFGDPTIDHPSTVILKPEPGTWPRLAALEDWGLTFMAHAGVPVPDHHVHHFDGIPVLVVDRYDRVLSDDPAQRRLHQEDLCMAVGARPEDKYARSHRSKTSLLNMARTIQDNADQPNSDIEDFVTTLVANISIGNCDAHARNTSLIHRSDGTVSLAPAYDVIPTYHYQGHDRILAQPINRQLMKPETVSADHLAAEISTWGIPGAHRVYSAAFERVAHAVRSMTTIESSPEVNGLLNQVDRLKPSRSP